jgi:hypothetical protein
VRKMILPMLLIIGSVAQASEWVRVASTSEPKHIFFIDTSSIRVSGNIRRGWRKTQYVPHTVQSWVGDTLKWEDYTLGREAFDCSTGASRTEGLMLYFEDGTYKEMPDSMYPYPWRPVPPDTALNSQLNFVCAWKPK